MKNKRASNPRARHNGQHATAPTVKSFTEEVPIEQLKPHPQNYVEHPEDEMTHLTESIRANGIYKNVVVANDYTILAGHGVVAAARELKYKTIPVKRLDLDPNSPQALKVLAGDNEIRHLAIVNDRALTTILKLINDEDPRGLLGTGFDPAMLAAYVMVTRSKSEIEDFNAAAAWVGMPEYDNPDRDFSLILHFASEAERAKFLKKNNVGEKYMKHFSGGIISLRWPIREKRDLLSVRFAREKEA